MGVLTFTEEVASSLPAGKLYKGFFLDIDTILPKILPDFIKSIEIEGDGGVGTIKNVTLAAGLKVVSMKQRVDVIDKEALAFTYSVIGGDILLGKLESIVNQFTVVPTGEGCLLKMTTIYNPIGDEVIPQENIKEAAEESAKLFKAVEAYILANLDEF
ncbi:pathogenesis-related protein 2 [Daucus carota subsp. sativus]|uniref:pathogenesis-related protein 2 n=1 Tax=Daucus carota subsp. sativus TaxID=79200 RepID=UPI0007EF74D9|nr:PREDICTED: pathogenesis-related protein 2-like [Daucus carota subsp. sativus]